MKNNTNHYSPFLKRSISFCFMMFLVIFHTAQDLNADISTVWVCNDGEKIEQDDFDNPNKAGNSAWNGSKAGIFGGRNEVLAFQIIIEAGSRGINSLTVTLSGLKQKEGSSQIVYTPPAKDPTLYTGRPIQIYTVNYMNVTKRTYADWFYPLDESHPAVPSDPVGLKPVQLIPENATTGRGGFPLQVKPSMNQAIWIEIYTGKNLPAGLYEGIIEINADGEKRSIPLELELFDFTLPDTNSIDAMIYYESGQPDMYHGTNQTNVLDPAYHRFAHRNRVEFVTAYNESTAPQYIDLFNGNAFTEKNGYEGPCMATGNNIIPRTFYGPGRDFETQEEAWAHSDAWMNWLDKNLPGKITFLYMPDEPSRESFPVIREYAKRIHGNPGPGRKLPIFVTKGYSAELDSPDQTIDIWCSFYGHYSIAQALIERSHGDDMWIYNGMRPYGGAMLIDTPAIDARVNMWVCYKHGINVYFNWHSCHWQHNSHIPSGYDRVQNIWIEPITFRNKHGNYANGDGCLVYPGQDVLHPDQDRCIEGPCSTITMANLRRGLQDHLYLTLAKKLGHEEAVNAALSKIVPKALSDVGKNEGVHFPQDGNAFEKERYKLAKIIAQTK
ncbi:MAG: DUF4091 domain-containing protein [Candidatus Latescibacteria bacterium]|nr:DUF4091 domain-containing protein [Candidatus Latescibacterota bacterium]